MIIQCRKCGTKYRFNKQRVTGKGVWVRCRNCETVFFQKNPLSEISSLMDLVDPERKAQGEVTEERDSALGKAEAEDAGQEPTWEDAYRDTGEGIEIERVEEDKPEEADAGDRGEVLGEIKIESGEPEPTWEDAYRDSGEGIGIERVEEDKPEGEATGDREKVLGDIKIESDKPELAGEDAYRDTGESIEIEGVKEDQPEEADAGDGEKVLGEIKIESDKTELAGEGVYRDADQEPQWEEPYGDTGEVSDSGGTRERQRVREPWAFGDADEVIHNETIRGRQRMRGLWTLGAKVVLYLALIALLSGGVYLWLVPEAREMISNKAFPWVEKVLGIKNSGGIEGVKETVVPKVEKMLGIEDKGAPDEGTELRVTLIDVGERFVRGWTAQTIMIVEGSAVNANKIPVSNIRVRGKILDASGKVLSEEESNGGTILTDDELKSLTGDEIKKELSNPYGRDFRNADIKPGDGIPFMLVFTMPVEEASELVVELMGIEAAKSK